jgi:ABC-type anion transport system duplicated permease subunit
MPNDWGNFVRNFKIGKLEFVRDVVPAPVPSMVQGLSFGASYSASSLNAAFLTVFITSLSQKHKETNVGAHL